MARRKIGLVLLVLSIATTVSAATLLTGGSSAQGCGITKVSKKARYFVGFGGGDSFADPAGAGRCTMNEQVDTGIGFLRHTFSWSEIRRDGFGPHDRWVAEAAEHKLNVLPIIFDTRGPKGHRPPKTSGFAKFAKSVVARYGPKGTLWNECGCPKRPIRTYQIWNEPNLKVYWLPKPNAKAYTNMVGAVRKQMRKAPGGRGIEVVSAGLPDSKSSRPGVYKYVTQMYRAGARKKMDALGFHPYAKNAKGTLDKLKKVRRIMNARGHKRGKIWVTEVGWATAGPKSEFRLGMSKVNREIKKLVPGLWKARKRMGLRGFQYYTWKDKPPYAELRSHWGFHAGLLKIDGSKKRTWRTFRSAVRRLG
jgi:hypothetical protein